MENDVTLAALASVGGATIAAGLIVQFVGIVAELSVRAKRLLSAFVGLFGVVGATLLLTPDPDAAVLVLSAFNGIIAGLAASKAYEVASKGLDATVERFDEGYNPGDYKPPTP